MKRLRINWFLVAVLSLLALFLGGAFWFNDAQIRRAELNHALIDAVQSSNAVEVNSLLSQGASPNARQEKDAPPPTIWQSFARLLPPLHRHHLTERDAPPTALILAVQHDNVQIAKALLDKGADVNAYYIDVIWTGNEKRMALEDSLISPDFILVKLLLDKGADVNWQDQHDNTYLMKVLAFGTGEYSMIRLHKFKATKVLVAAGANVNLRNKNGETALIGMATLPEPMRLAPAIAALLLKNGANVNDKDNSGRTALMGSVADLPLSRFLVANGADVNVRDKGGNTALMYAAERDQPATVKLLLDKGGNINEQDSYGETALIKATRTSASPIIDFRGAETYPYPTTVDLLLKRGANVNLRGKSGRTALIVAAEAIAPKAALLLLDKKADVNARDDYGRTALMIAAAKGQAATVRALLRHGAAVNDRDVKGHTALSRATAHHRSDLVKMLKTAGETR